MSRHLGVIVGAITAAGSAGFLSLHKGPLIGIAVGILIGALVGLMVGVVVKSRTT